MAQERTWSEIKLRNPSQEFQTGLNRVLDLFNEATASKAIERIVASYVGDYEKRQELESTVADLRREIADLKYQLKKKQSEIDNIKDVYRNLHGLLSK